MTDRTTIAIEGAWTTDQRRIEPGALWWDDGPLAVVEWRQWHPTVHYGTPRFIGTLTDIRREDDGRITALGHYAVVRGRFVVADLADVHMESDGNTEVPPRLIITHAKIVGAVSIPIGMWPWPPLHEMRR